MDERTKQEKFIEHLINALNESAEVRQAVLSLINNNKEIIFDNGSTASNTDSKKSEVLSSRNDDLIPENKLLKKQLESILSDNEQLKQENEYLEQKLKDEVNKIDALKSSLLEKENKIAAHGAKTRELNSQIAALQDKLLQFERSIGELVLLYEKYSKLSINTKDQLSNIICSYNLIGFIVSCSDLKNLEGLWDYNKSLIMTGSNNNELTVLKEVFDVFFKVYNSSSKNPRCVYDNTKEGDLFDDDLHVKAKNSRVQGKISAVLLRGYRSAVTNNPIRKSVVMV